MPDTSKLLEKTLKDQGHSMTKPRLVIYNYLSKHAPLTMSALIQGVVPYIDRASAYRTVSLFEKLGVIHRITVGWKYTLELSDVFHHHHHHLSCTDCNAVIPIKENAQLEKLIAEFAKTENFTLTSHYLELHGLCPNCNAKTMPK